MELTTGIDQRRNCGFGFAISTCAFLLFAVTAKADLVLNGDFSGTVCTGLYASCTTGQTGVDGQLPSTIGVTGGIVTLNEWTVNGYNYIFNPGTADTTGSVSSEYYPATVTLWSSTTNGGLDPYTPPPGDSNFFGSDPVYQTPVGPELSQTINGLTVGDQYAVTFYWAAAQQTVESGATTEGWTVGLGGQTFSTPIFDLPSEGFSGWMPETFVFTATDTSEVLSFLADGSPTGLPPFDLLSGVNLNQVPEPGYWIPGIGIMGLMLILGFFRSKKAVKS